MVSKWSLALGLVGAPRASCHFISDRDVTKPYTLPAIRLVIARGLLACYTVR